ncbi:hypothetical protein TNCV_3532761 [Trichonephila clavipes]|nr:hypothetical protein TNCV_3532761 [Trichonephila clavipes]
MITDSWRGHSSLVVKVTDSWRACHEFQPVTTEDTQCGGGAMHIKFIEAQTSSHWFDGKVRREGARAQVLSSSSDHGSKLRLSPKALE